MSILHTLQLVLHSLSHTHTHTHFNKDDWREAVGNHQSACSTIWWQLCLCLLYSSLKHLLLVSIFKSASSLHLHLACCLYSMSHLFLFLSLSAHLYFFPPLAFPAAPGCYTYSLICPKSAPRFSVHSHYSLQGSHKNFCLNWLWRMSPSANLKVSGSINGVPSAHIKMSLGLTRPLIHWCVRWRKNNCTSLKKNLLIHKCAVAGCSFWIINKTRTTHH